MPERICLFSGIKRLDLRNNSLTVLNKCLDNFNSLEYLNLTKNTFTEIPERVLELESLKELHIAQNPVKNLPTALKKLNNLEVLDLWDTDIEEVPEWIVEMENLKVLDVRNTYLKTADLEWLFKVRPDLKVESSFGCNCD